MIYLYIKMLQVKNFIYKHSFDKSMKKIKSLTVKWFYKKTLLNNVLK